MIVIQQPVRVGAPFGLAMLTGTLMSSPHRLASYKYERAS